MSLQRICVFCGSSESVPPEYLQAAREMGQAIAAQGISLVYGGGGTGMMGAVAEGALTAGGEAIGVTIKLFSNAALSRPDLSELYVCENLHERKAKMGELSDGFVALPGGLGTLDELVESLTWAQLGLHAKPVGLLNQNGYFNPLLSMLDQARQVGFLYSEQADLLIHEQQPARLLERMKTFRPRVDLGERWLKQASLQASKLTGPERTG
jgi:uncharacterized protein (TIGR00730 family)